jgi:hypothetical protein
VELSKLGVHPMKRRKFSTLLVIFLAILFAGRIAAQDVLTLEGYILIPNQDTLQLEGFDLDQSANAIPSGARQTTELNAEWQYSALAPNGSRLASIVADVQSNFMLEVTELSARAVIRQPLPRTQDAQFGYVLKWSPDSSRIILSPSSLLEATLILDLQTQRLLPIQVGYSVGLQWLPDSNRFIFNGPSICGDACRASSDVYLGAFSTEGISVRPLTRLDIATLDLRGYVPLADLGLGHLTWNPVNERIYGTIGSDSMNPGGFELLYSLDMQGNVTYEANIGASIPDAIFPPQIQRILFSKADNNLYLVVYTDGTTASNGLPQIHIMRFVPGAGLTRLFEFTSSGFNVQVRLPDSIELSPDGRFLAIGTIDPTGSRAGSLIVVDLLQANTIVQVDNIRPVCQVSWTADSSNVLYTQTDNQACARYFENQPVSQLAALNLATRESRVVQQAVEAPFYFLSRGQ